MLSSSQPLGATRNRLGTRTETTKGVDVQLSIAPSRRALKLVTFVTFWLLGLTTLLEAEHAHDLAFLFQYATRWGQDLLTFFRGA